MIWMKYRRPDEDIPIELVLVSQPLDNKIIKTD